MSKTNKKVKCAVCGAGMTIDESKELGLCGKCVAEERFAEWEDAKYDYNIIHHAVWMKNKIKKEREKLKQKLGVVKC